MYRLPPTPPSLYNPRDWEKMNDRKNRILESDKFQVSLATGDPAECILSLF